MTKPKYREAWIWSGPEAWHTDEVVFNPECKKDHHLHVIEHRALTDLQEQCDRLRDSIYEAIEGTSSTLEDMQHYFENKCVPTADEVNQLAITDSKLRLALAEYRKWKTNQGENE